MIQYKLLLLNNLGVFTVFVIRCVRTKNLRLEVSFLYSNRYFTRQWTKKILSTLMCAWALYATKYIYFFIASYQRVQREFGVDTLHSMPTLRHFCYSLYSKFLRLSGWTQHPALSRYHNLQSHAFVCATTDSCFIYIHFYFFLYILFLYYLLSDWQTTHG